MALAACVQEGLFLAHLLHDIDAHCQYEPFTVFEDNQGAIALVENPVHHQRSKHIDIRYYFICDQCIQGNVNVKYGPSSDMIADILTKCVFRHTLNQFKDFLFGK